MASTSDFSYGSHLQLDKLLDAQAPVSGQHDELLFIIQHQTSELWFRLILSEIDAARGFLTAGDPRGASKPLKRVATVLEHLVASWDVLRSLSPLDFAAFRGALGEASGLQSWQYRLVEFALGNRVLAHVEPHRGDPETLARLQAEVAQPSLYQAALGLLAARLDVTLPAEAFLTDRPYTGHVEVRAAWSAVYAAPRDQRDLLELAEQLVEIEDRFRCWRFNHVTTVERVIGFKTGTGGTSGVGYLRRMLEQSFFPELWELRGTL